MELRGRREGEGGIEREEGGRVGKSIIKPAVTSIHTRHGIHSIQAHVPRCLLLHNLRPRPVYLSHPVYEGVGASPVQSGGGVYA